jgi:hypothetical protein
MPPQPATAQRSRHHLRDVAVRSAHKCWQQHVQRLHHEYVRQGGGVSQQQLAAAVVTWGQGRFVWPYCARGAHSKAPCHQPTTVGGKKVARHNTGLQGGCRGRVAWQWHEQQVQVCLRACGERAQPCVVWRVPWCEACSGGCCGAEPFLQRAMDGQRTWYICPVCSPGYTTAVSTAAAALLALLPC